ncbi:MAG: hypothetical protein ACPG5P_04690, partial [Saprospiraceae bacterium]
MFKTGNKNFWIAQLIGWFILSFSNMVIQLIGEMPIRYVFLNAALPFIIGFLISTGFRYVIKNRKWKHWGIGKLLLLILISTLIQTALLNGIIFTIFNFISPDIKLNLPMILSNMFIFGILFLSW